MVAEQGYRYMAAGHLGTGNTFRRVFAMWAAGQGAICGVAWPNKFNIGVYNASTARRWNVIAYGRSLKGILRQSNSDAAIQQPRWSIAVLQGRNHDGSDVDPRDRPAAATARPGPTTCTGITSWGWLAQRYGMGLYGQGTMCRATSSATFWRQITRRWFFPPGAPYMRRAHRGQRHRARDADRQRAGADRQRDDGRAQHLRQPGHDCVHHGQPILARLE